MKILNRIFSFALAIVFIGAFYVVAVLLDSTDEGKDTQFVVEMATLPLSPMQSLRSQDAQALTNAFGAPLPLPENFAIGQVEDTSYHTYQARKVHLQGENAQVFGIRPASAAPKIMDKSLTFLSAQRTLLGYPLSVAQTPTGPVYALLTEDAAFLITPISGELPGNFSLMQISP